MHSTVSRALDAYNKCLNLAPVGWLERATALGNRAAVLVMLHRCAFFHPTYRRTTHELICLILLSSPQV
jgi:hypothetical protein